MAHTDIYVASSVNADRWAAYYGQDDSRNLSQSCKSSTEALAQVKAVCYLYQCWVDDTRPLERTITFHSHGWTAVERQIPSNAEPALRYLSALFDLMKTVHPSIVVEFALVPDGVDSENMKGAQILARSTENEEEPEYEALTLSVRQRMVEIAQKAREDELSMAQRLREEAEGQMKRQPAEGIQQHLPMDPPPAGEVDEGELSSPSEDEQEEDSSARAGELRTCIPITSVEANEKLATDKRRPELLRFADLCARLILNYPNVRVHWYATRGEKSHIDAMLPAIRRGREERTGIKKCPGIRYRNMEQVCNQLFKQAKGAVDSKPIILVVTCSQSLPSSCIGNLPFLVAAASTKSAPVKLLSLRAKLWDSMFLGAKHVQPWERCFALTASEYTESDLFTTFIDSLSPLVITDVPDTVGLKDSQSGRKRDRENAMPGPETKRSRQR
ncbi:hypothetical protein CYLTODRAFT_491329 [Cylindrobasidium torrendii FP15055 ss-10]|uniref:Uncharacterized protein n=1 Tax=Cylindrobasidium torrendii FP15055 ss-10 TaxID=1314674 RepID=A0A0D7B8U9_9AGAR|nr:hypothetical protein CYLTODRAFT_491329 [Cylindrobasidium torrendii FP15055 ss-10]